MGGQRRPPAVRGRHGVAGEGRWRDGAGLPVLGLGRQLHGPQFQEMPKVLPGMLMILMTHQLLCFSQAARRHLVERLQVEHAEAARVCSGRGAVADVDGRDARFS